MKNDVIRTADSRKAKTISACQQACVNENNCKNFMFRILNGPKFACLLFKTDEMEIKLVDQNFGNTFTGPKKCPEDAENYC